MASGGSASSEAIRAKNAGEGFSTPHAAEVATRSSSIPTAARISAARSGLVPGDPDAEPEPAQLLQTRASVRVEVFGAKAGRRRAVPVRLSLHWSRCAEDFEDLLVVPTLSDQATEDRQKGESWHARPIRPRPTTRASHRSTSRRSRRPPPRGVSADRSRCSPRRLWRPIPVERQRQPLLAGHRGETRCLTRQLHEGRLRDGVAGPERRVADLA